MTDMMAAQAWRTNAHMLADLFRIMPKLRPISMGRANDVVAMMGDRPITWWFDVVHEPEFEIGAVAEFTNGWCADVELTSNPYSKRLRLKYRSRVSSDWSTRQHHNTWRQALARAESGGAA